MARTILDTPITVPLHFVFRELREGELLIPKFQRSLVWTEQQRFTLLDSVNRGLPIGSIMVWRTARPDPLGTYQKLGRHVLRPEERPLPKGRKSYLIDGLQRIATLFMAMHTPESNEASSPGEFEPIYYDLLYEDKLQRHSSFGFHLLKDQNFPPPSTWVPLDSFFDPGKFQTFRRELIRQKRDNLANNAERMMNRFKIYPIPIIPIVTDEFGLVVESFLRINTSGTKMAEHHLFSSLTADKPYDSVAGLQRIKDALAAHQWPDVDERFLFDVIKTSFNLDQRYDSIHTLQEWIVEEGGAKVYENLAVAMKNVVDFLRACGITHPKMLPYEYQFGALTYAAKFADSLLDKGFTDKLKTWFWATTYAEHFSNTDSSRRLDALIHLEKLVKSNGATDALPPNLPPAMPLFRECTPGSPRSVPLALVLAENKPLDSQGALWNVESPFAEQGATCLLNLAPDKAVNDVGNLCLARPDDIDKLRQVLRREIPAWVQELEDPHERAQAEAAIYEPLDAICQSHFISSDAWRAFFDQRFDDFFELRRNAVNEALRTHLTQWGLQFVGVSETKYLPRVWRIAYVDYTRGRYWDEIIRTAGMLSSSVNVPIQGRIDQAWLEKNARDDRGEVSTELAGRFLLANRIAEFKEHAAADEPLRIGLFSHILSQIPHPYTALLYGYIEPWGAPIDDRWQAEVLRMWKALIEQPLLWARDALAAQGLYDVIFHPRCHLGIVMRAGAIFHLQTGFSVGCDQNGEIWDIVREPSGNDRPPLWTLDRTEEPNHEEIHLLVSITQDVTRKYEAWRTRKSPGTALRLHFHLASGVGRTSLSKYDVVDAAQQIAATILSIPPPETTFANNESPLRRIRVFYAGPVAFAMALGAMMNTWGDVITMDYSKNAGDYFESFRFRS